ncbi:MAG: ATP-dependent DNA helicase UvrD2 [Acidimicrobiia bacterium]|nr:ATP-dependent DNA helicase UvrD2 [Acidimicrobiia bacterium]
MVFPGPVQLGRGVVVNAGDPDPIEGLSRVRVDQDLLDSPESLAGTVDRLHRAWSAREPVAVELAVDQEVLRRPVVEERRLWLLGTDFTILRERLHFLVWANNWDCRGAAPVWWWAAKAAGLGAGEGGTADIVLRNGEHAWVDGGPREPLGLPVVHAESVEAGRLRLAGAPAWSGPDLDPSQRAAVEHGGGPARIIATAGSGKTRTLLARLAHLVDHRGVEPGLVTAVAYNNRAAAQMRERLGRRDLHIRTIHSLGWAIVREALPEARLLNEGEVRGRLRGLVPSRRVLNKDVIGPYLEALSDTRLALRDPAEVEEERDDIPGFAEVFRRYRYRLERHGLVDYDEQIYRSVELLLRDPGIRARWQARCRHLLVDEFQDLTPAYVLLLRVLSSPRLNVFGVGDDDQTIYGYAGADPRFLVDFDRYFPGAAEHALEVNYRSPVAAIKAGNHLLAGNRVRVPKAVRPAPGSPDGTDRLLILERPDPELTADAIDLVRTWLADGTPPGQVAVLARVNSALLPVLAGLDRAGFPLNSRIEPGLLDRSAMRSVMAWIRLGLRPEEMGRLDLLEAVRRPSRGLNRLADRRLQRSVYTLEDLRELVGGLEGRQAEAWITWVQDIAGLAGKARNGRVGPVLRRLIDGIGLGRSAHLLDRNRTRVDKAGHADDLVALRRTASVYGEVGTFEEDLRAVLARHRGAGEVRDGVTLSTVHRVKGMEWDRVLVFGADRGLMPHDLSENVEEERRILYVAVTRARRQAVVVADARRPSRFLAEMRGRPARETREARGSTARSRVAAAAPAPPEDVDPELFEKLKNWRRDRSRELQVPAYRVFSNQTLEGIAARQPRNDQELLAVNGVGPTKLALFGAEVLEIVRESSPS